MGVRTKPDQARCSTCHSCANGAACYTRAQWQRTRRSPHQEGNTMNAPAVQLPPMPTRTLRNAGIGDIIEVLEHQQRQKVDVVFPARNIRITDGMLGVACLDEVDVPEAISLHGVTPAMKLDVNGFYLPT